MCTLRYVCRANPRLIEGANLSSVTKVVVGAVPTHEHRHFSAARRGNDPLVTRLFLDPRTRVLIGCRADFSQFAHDPLM
jgi:hypothetical protein